MRIGYACLILGVPECNLKRLTLKNTDGKKIHEVIKHNLSVLDKMIDYNIANNIKLFRISSDIIPFASHEANDIKWWMEYRETFEAIGQKIKKAGIRVSMHPGQYTVLNSPEEKVVQNALLDLLYHARFLDALQVDTSHKIILHIGGLYGNKKEAILRFINNYRKLPHIVKERLVIENDEKCFHIEDVLYIGEKLNMPVVFDNLHHTINPAGNNSIIEWIKISSQTWSPKDGNQKIHYSEQDPDGKKGAHSPTINSKIFYHFYQGLKENCLYPDIMLEVKDKNLSALKCIHITSDKLPASALEKEWARYKYLVLSRSQQTYLEIRELLKDKSQGYPLFFYEKIEQCLSLPPNKGEEINAVNHIWGYFKNRADTREKARFHKLMREWSEDKTSLKNIKNFLLKLALKYDEEYIKYSYFFI